MVPPSVTNVLPSADSATGRGLKAGVYSTLVSFVVFSTGLFLALKGVPGCSEALVQYLQQNAVTLALSIGIPTGLVSFIVNLFRKNVPNYN